MCVHVTRMVGYKYSLGKVLNRETTNKTTVLIWRHQIYHNCRFINVAQIIIIIKDNWQDKRQ